MKSQRSVPAIEHGVGKAVRVTWVDERPSSDEVYWHNYRVIGVWGAVRMLLLEGMDEGDLTFTSSPIWVPVEHIEFMEVIE
jgi:hypothetical protein